MKERAEGAASPSFALILTTMLAAVFAFSIHAPSIELWWRYPVLCMSDPVRALFVLGERERHLALAESGKDRFGFDRGEPAPNLEDWQQLHAEVDAFRGETHLDQGWLAPAASADVVLAVLMAGYGSPKALRFLDTATHDPPHYAKARLQEIRSGEWEHDRRRAFVAARWSSVLRVLEHAILAGGALGLLIQWWGKRFYQRPAVTRIVGLPLSRAVFVFVGAEAALAAVYWLFAPERESFSATLDWLPSVVWVCAGLVLVRSVSGSWGASPLARTLRLPATGGERRYLVLIALLALGASHGFGFLVQRVASLFGLHSRASEGVMESILYGPPGDAWLAAAASVTATPFAEELLFRGVLFGGLAQRMSAHKAALCSAALFALSHGYGFLGSLSLLATGYILARVYQYSGSLLPCIAVHVVNNVVAALWEVACRT